MIGRGEREGETTYGYIRVEPLSTALGAEISGVDLGGPPAELALAEIRHASEELRIMRAKLFSLVLISAASAAAPLATAQLLTHRDLSYAMAKTIAETAIDSCAAKGYAVSAVVVDRDGEVIVAMRADNAGPHTMENARRKAYTARSFFAPRLLPMPSATPTTTRWFTSR